jgi:nicotinamide-nucleotide amidase
VSESAAAQVLSMLQARGETLAVAESLTGGLVTAALTDVPGASASVRGGVVAYATELKSTLLGVDAGLLADRGAVDPDVAAEMADGVRRRLGATHGLATTGVAGPDAQDGKAPGTVHVAVAGPSGRRRARSLAVPGGRAEVRAETVREALDLLVDHLADPGSE